MIHQVQVRALTQTLRSPSLPIWEVIARRTSDEECQQHNEETPINRPRNPSEPTPEEKEKHYLPYRSWCPECVKARGREDPHRSQKQSKDEDLPRKSMDYATVGNDQEGSYSRKLLLDVIDTLSLRSAT